jgi:hypothetical protein
MPNIWRSSRHPVIRTVSHFYHLLNVDLSNDGDLARQYEDVNLYFKSERPWYFENFMCRIISGEPYSQLDDQELFRRAMDKIEKRYSFVGIKEHMELSLLALSKLFDEPIEAHSNVNIGSYNISMVSDNTLDIILSRNYADILLYN